MYLPDIFNYVKSGNIDQVKSFIKQKYNLNIENKNSHNLAQMAIMYDHLDILKILLDAGISPNTIDSRNSSLLHTCSLYSRHEHSIELLKRSAVFNHKDTNGNTSLHLSTGVPETLVLQQLINHGDNVNEQDNNGNTPLHLSCIIYFQHIEYLLKFGANINLPNIKGDTPLHFAAQYNNFNAVKILISHDCNIELKNDDGLTAFDIAIKNNKKECLQIFYTLDLFKSLNKDILQFNKISHHKVKKL